MGRTRRLLLGGFGMAGAAFAYAGFATAPACVPPDDSAPRYGSFAFDFSSSAATGSEGFATGDGWTVHFTRTVIVPPSVFVRRFGAVLVPGSTVTHENPSTAEIQSCVDTGHSTDGLRYFIGTIDPRIGWTEFWNRLEENSCDRFFTLSSSNSYIPVDDFTRPGPGTTKADVEDMGRDDSGTAILEGTATKDERAMRFQLRLNLDTLNAGVGRQTDAARCQVRSSETRVVVGARIRFQYVFHPESLFRDALRGENTLRFDPFAIADERHGDGDGLVTMAELSRLPVRELCDLGKGTAYTDFLDDTGSGTGGGTSRDSRANFAEYVSAAYASVWTLEGRDCIFESAADMEEEQGRPVGGDAGTRACPVP